MTIKEHDLGNLNKLAINHEVLMMAHSLMSLSAKSRGGIVRPVEVVGLFAPKKTTH